MQPDHQTRTRFHALVDKTRQARTQVADLIRAGQWERAEQDAARATAFDQRMKRSGAESLRGKTVDFLPTPFLDQGARICRSVGKIVVSWGGATDLGTGVLIAPGILLTNEHVLRGEDSARLAIIEFDFEDDRRAQRRTSSTYTLAPDQGFVASPEIGGLDYAIVALGTRIAGSAALEELAISPLMDTPNRHRIGMPVNIIQHPGGRHRAVALRENRLLHRADHVLLYETDTEPGSSGAPVYNDDWELIALHHYGEPFLALEGGVTLSNPALNEGIRISEIVKDLRNRLAQAREHGGPASRIALIERVLQYGASASTGTPRKRLQPNPGSAGSESLASAPPHGTSQENGMQDVRISFPEGVSELSVVIRFPPSGRPASPVALSAPGTAPTVVRPVLRPASESQRIDRDYDNRTGFDGDFLDSMPIDLDAIIAPRRAKAAPLLSGNGIVLTYEHFSVVMHRTRRLAMLTATNIDGPTYLSINRKTGKITPLAAEGETWYTDPRIADEYIVTQAWYSEWSHLFDRGHLTRRNDPTWGDEASARKAEKDTFHFTNCTPQHWKFNQFSRFWQGIEQYVLENGVKQTQARLTVLQGPVFGENDELGDELAIPHRFWKLVAWRGQDDTPRALAFVASQQELFGEERGGSTTPEDDVMDIGQYQVAINELQRMTGLDFGALQAWDTFGELPTAGEARRFVKQWSDIRIG